MGRGRGLGVRRRIKYLLWRISGFDIGNLFRIAKTLSKDVWKPQLFIVVDMLWCSVVHETGFSDYRDWDFHLLRRRERKTYMTHSKSNHLAQLLNKKEFRHLFSDKSEFNRGFGAYLGREWLDVRTSSVDELRDFVVRHERVMVKVADSEGGQGISQRDAKDIHDFDSFRNELLENRQFLVEQLIPQHAQMAALCPTSVNSLRVVSYFDGTDVHVLATVLKIGNGGDVDNFSHGGMYTMLDESGVANYPAFDATGTAYRSHPMTGTDIVGFTVPMFDQVLRLVDEVARIVPQIAYVGWDIAISPDRPVIIEGNYNTGVFQMKPSLSDVKTGLLPRYREVIGF